LTASRLAFTASDKMPDSAPRTRRTVLARLPAGTMRRSTLPPKHIDVATPQSWFDMVAKVVAFGTTSQLSHSKPADRDFTADDQQLRGAYEGGKAMAEAALYQGWGGVARNR
jgi:hypothetical protein